MTERKCPYCNEPVPSNSINCPACYKSLTREYEVKEQDTDRNGNVQKDKSRKIAVGLSIIPGVFGFMGLGQMYLGDTKRGLAFLLFGLPMMLILAFILSSVGDLSTGWTILAIGALILIGIPYVLLFLFQVMDAAASSTFRSISSLFS